MDEQQRKRAGRALAYRMRDTGQSVGTVARTARVPARALRAFISGRADLDAEAQHALEHAVGWPAGELARYAAGRDGAYPASGELGSIGELIRRAVGDAPNSPEQPR